MNFVQSKIQTIPGVTRTYTLPTTPIRKYFRRWKSNFAWKANQSSIPFFCQNLESNMRVDYAARRRNMVSHKNVLRLQNQYTQYSTYFRSPIIPAHETFFLGVVALPSLMWTYHVWRNVAHRTRSGNLDRRNVFWVSPFFSLIKMTPHKNTYSFHPIMTQISPTLTMMITGPEFSASCPWTERLNVQSSPRIAKRRPPTRDKILRNLFSIAYSFLHA